MGFLVASAVGGRKGVQVGLRAGRSLRSRVRARRALPSRAAWRFRRALRSFRFTVAGAGFVGGLRTFSLAREEFSGLPDRAGPTKCIKLFSSVIGCFYCNLTLLLQFNVSLINSC